MGRAGNFVVVAENAVAAQFEAADAGFGLFFGQHGLQLLLAVLHQVQQAVQLHIVANFEQPALRDHGGRSIHQSGSKEGGAVFHAVPGAEYFFYGLGGRGILFALIGRKRVLQGRQHLGQGGQTLPQSNAVARRTLI